MTVEEIISVRAHQRKKPGKASKKSKGGLSSTYLPPSKHKPFTSADKKRPPFNKPKPLNLS